MGQNETLPSGFLDCSIFYLFFGKMSKPLGLLFEGIQYCCKRLREIVRDTPYELYWSQLVSWFVGLLVVPSSLVQNLVSRVTLVFL